MRHRKTLLLAALAVTLGAREARGDITHLKSPSQVETEKGSKLTLPPGYFLDEETWQARDLELKQLQELDTRLNAENKSLRQSADSPHWLAIGISGVLGVAAGVALVLYVK